MSLNANALINFPYIQSITNTQPSAQVQMEALINVVSTEIENVCHRKLAQQDITEYITYSDNRFLKPNIMGVSINQAMPYNGYYKAISLNGYPISGTPIVYMDANQVWGAGTQVTNFLINNDMGIIYFDPTVIIPTQPNAIKIVYTAGYDPVPEDLKMACLEAVQWYVKRLNSNSAGNKDSNKDGVSVSYELGLPIHVLKIINNYKNPT